MSHSISLRSLGDSREYISELSHPRGKETGVLILQLLSAIVRWLLPKDSDPPAGTVPEKDQEPEVLVLRC